MQSLCPSLFRCITTPATPSLGPQLLHPHQIRMPSADYVRVFKDLASFSETVNITATKEGVKFSASGDLGTANITCK
jgi:proliferating cell nuclear antigen